MSAQKLFGNRVTPACKYCRHNLKYIEKDDTCFCPKKGVVAGGYKCRAYIYDPLKRSPRKTTEKRDYKEEEFAL